MEIKTNKRKASTFCEDMSVEIAKIIYSVLVEKRAEAKAAFKERFPNNKFDCPEFGCAGPWIFYEVSWDHQVQRLQYQFCSDRWSRFVDACELDKMLKNGKMKYLPAK